MQSLTNAVILINPELPSDGLFQHMHNPTHLLDLLDIYQSPGVTKQDGGIGQCLTCALISDVIRKLHGNTVSMIYEGSNDMPLSMPEVKKLAHSKMDFQQFSVIFENSDSVAGTMKVHDSIFLVQLGLNATDNPDNPDNTHKDNFKRHL